MNQRETRAAVSAVLPASTSGGDVTSAEAVLKDCYHAALNGLHASIQHKRGAREKLAFIARRIEEHYETFGGFNLEGGE